MTLVDEEHQDWLELGEEIVDHYSTKLPMKGPRQLQLQQRQKGDGLSM